MATLFWMNCGGMEFFIVIFVEMIICVMISMKNKKPEPMGNVMYISFSSADLMTLLFWFYRIITAYLYLILTTIFAVIPFETYKVEKHEVRYNITIANGYGMTMLVYAWIVTPIWHSILLYIYLTTKHFGKQLARNLETCMR
eukprot:232253_1